MSSDPLPPDWPGNPSPCPRSRRPVFLIVACVLAGLLTAAPGAALLLASNAGAAWFDPDLQRLAGLILLLVAVALLALGLGIEVFWPILQGQAAAGFGSHRVVLSTTLFTVLLAFLAGNLVPLVVLSSTGQHDLHNVPGFLSAALSVSAVLLSVAYVRFIRPGVVSLEYFGLGRRKSGPGTWLADLAAGLGGGFGVLALSAATQALMRLAGVQQTQMKDYTWIRALPLGDFLLVFLAGAVIAPLAEEIFFRGLVFRPYLLAKGPLVAYPISAVVFGLLHLNVEAFLPILVLGLALAWLYQATGSILPGVIAHGLNNGVAFAVLYFAPQSALS